MTASRSRREPTIALINIVFLMLIFFMAAATLASPLDADLRLVRTEDIEGRVHAEGRRRYRGAAVVDAAAYVAALPEAARATLRLVPDAALPAADLLRLGEALRRAGAGRIVIVTERGLP